MSSISGLLLLLLMGLPCPSFLALPVGICLEMDAICTTTNCCLDGPEQQIPPKHSVRTLSWFIHVHIGLFPLPSPQGDFNKTKMRIDEL